MELTFSILSDGKPSCRTEIFAPLHTYDVIVVGLGTAGAFAMLGAVKNNLDTLGIELGTSLGGIGTRGGVWDYYYGARGGLFEKIDKKCFEAESRGYCSVDNEHNRRKVNGALKQYILENEVAGKNSTIYFEALLTGVFLDGDRVAGVRIFCGGVFADYGCKVLIDSTGNSIGARMAGAKFHGGRSYDGGFGKVSKGVVRHNSGTGCLTCGWGRGCIGGCESYSELSQIVMASYCASPNLCESFGINSRIIYDASILGVREFPCIEAKEDYTIDDFRQRKRTDRPVFFCVTPFDGTNSVMFEDKITQDIRFISMFNNPICFGVPMDIMIPEGIGGILCASRGCGTGHDMSGAFRMKRDMQKLGEAAAAVACTAVRDGVDVCDADYEKVKALLEPTGCFNACDDADFAETFNDDMQNYKPAFFPTETEEIKKLLSGDDCSTALMKIYTSPLDYLKSELHTWLDSDNRLLSLHSAYALAMRNDLSSARVLRDELGREPHIPKRPLSMWCHYIPDFSKCLLLLGRLGCTDVYDIAHEIISDRARTLASRYPKVLGYTGPGAYEKHFLSLCAAALYELSKTASFGIDVDFKKLSDEAVRISLEF